MHIYTVLCEAWKEYLEGGDNKIMVRDFLPQPPNEALHTIVNSTAYYSQLTKYIYQTGPGLKKN